MRLVKFKRLFLSTLFLSLPLNSSLVFANEFLKEDYKNVLIAQTNDNYREHEDGSEDEDDIHSIDHNWKNHYHTISSIRLRSNGNLRIRFCEKVELLEGKVLIDDNVYKVEDAQKITKRKIVWRINKKGTFENGSSVFINTENFLGRPIEKNPNPNEIRSLERGCGLPFLYLPPGVEVSKDSNVLPIIGLVIAIGAAAAGGGGSSSGSGSASSN